MTANVLIKTLRQAKMIDDNLINAYLATGDLRRVRNCGEKTYLKMCSLFGVTPKPLPVAPRTQLEKFTARGLQNRINTHKRAIKRLEHTLNAWISENCLTDSGSCAGWRTLFFDTEKVLADLQRLEVKAVSQHAWEK